MSLQSSAHETLWYLTSQCPRSASGVSSRSISTPSSYKNLSDPGQSCSSALYLFFYTGGWSVQIPFKFWIIPYSVNSHNHPSRLFRGWPLNCSTFIGSSKHSSPSTISTSPVVKLIGISHRLENPTSHQLLPPPIHQTDSESSGWAVARANQNGPQEQIHTTPA